MGVGRRDVAQATSNNPHLGNFRIGRDGERSERLAQRLRYLLVGGRGQCSLYGRYSRQKNLILAVRIPPVQCTRC